MLDIQYEKSFKKDFKRIIKRGYNPKLLEEVITMLCNEEVLPEKYRIMPVVVCFYYIK